MKDNMQNKRRVLCDAAEVQADSLPLSLRHYSPGDALEEAKAIAHFFSHAVEAFSDYESGVNAEGYRGFTLVLDLLIDKLDIGRGSYKFPTVGWDDDLPALVEKEGGAS